MLFRSMSVFDATMFEKPAIIDDFTFALLQETGIHFWKYNIMKDQIIFRRRQLADRNKMEVLENGMEQFEENIIFENSDRNRIRKMHERIQNGEKSTVEGPYVKCRAKESVATTAITINSTA